MPGTSLLNSEIFAFTEAKQNLQFIFCLIFSLGWAQVLSRYSKQINFGRGPEYTTLRGPLSAIDVTRCTKRKKTQKS